MTDMKIYHEWSDEHACNVFSVFSVFSVGASMHPAYDQMYKSFNNTPADRNGVRKRCQALHEIRDPNLPSIEDELVDQMAAEISREIDEEIMRDLMAMMNKGRK